MNPNTVKLVDGGWTPALHQMAVEIIDSLINRPASAVISDPKLHSHSLQSVREKLAKKKYSTIEDWASDMRLIFKNASQTNNEFAIDVAEELETKFNKKYDQLVELSHFKFRTATQRIIDDIDSIREKFSDLE